MYYYRTIIQYEGTNYAGFQWQHGIQTIQSELNDALSRITHGKFSTTAASRTDTGVHALEQIVKITIANPIELESFLKDFNEKLPPQIKCCDIKTCEGSFRPASSAVSKEYRYLFTNKTQVSKKDSQFIANISNGLDFAKMKACIDSLNGVHDFRNFYSRGSNVKSTTRHILYCELTEIFPHDVLSQSNLFQLPPDLQTCYQFKIVGNGFLKQMIRHIVSALWMVGSGKISSSDFTTLLNGPQKEKQLWKVASPNGLYLYRINYVKHPWE